MKDFYELSKEIFWDEKKEIIKKLYKEKTLQLEYVEMIISSYFKVDEDNNNIIDIDENEDEAELKYLLELQIKLLCELKKFDDIVPTLKLSSFYPLKECFEYCDKAGAYEACIYIYLREANYENALHLATKKLNEVYDELYQNVNKENNEEKKKKLIINFDKYLNDCKRICEDNYQEDLWFELLQTLYNYEKNSSNINDNIGFNELNQKMLQEIKELMEKMSAYVSISRIIEVVTELAFHLITLAGKDSGMSPEVLREEIRARLKDGSCFEKFKSLIRSQGGELSPSGLPVYVDKPFDCMHVNSPDAGYVQGMRADLIGQASVLLGAGRLAKTDTIDYGAGIGFFVKIGDRVERGDSLCALYQGENSNLPEERLFDAMDLILEAYKIGPEKPDKKPAILDVIT